MSAEFKSLEEDELCNILRRFYASLVSKEGKTYSKSSLIGMRGAIQRHLTGGTVKRIINIVSGPQFKSANDVLAGKIKKMKIDGEDKAKSYPPINQADLEKIFSTKTLLVDDPTSLLFKTFFELCLHFGRRGREGLRDLKKKDLVFHVDEVGVEYCTLGFNPSEKNHQGISKRDCEHDQRLYGTGGSRCPLISLKKYVNKLHPECIALFQRAKDTNWVGEDIWYCNSPVGANTLAKFMGIISQKAGLKTTYSNHSIRATTVTTLREAGVHVNDIMAVTGHKCAQSIMSYSKTSEHARRHMSHQLSAQAGYMIETASPAKKKFAIPAALGRAPETNTSLPEITFPVPPKASNIDIISKGNELAIPENLVSNSQVVKVNKAGDYNASMAIANAIFPHAEGCTFNLTGCTFNFK